MWCTSGERECSLQRRHQKVIEEAPSPLLDPDDPRADRRRRLRYRRAASSTPARARWSSSSRADRPDEFFFMEMNTRLQVEHPVTEMVTGVDLVEWQVRIAAGEKLTVGQADIALRGHAIEARVYAEDPARGFLPTGGDVLAADGARRGRRPGRLGPVRGDGRRQRLRPDAGEGDRLRAGSGRRRCAPWTGLWQTPRCSASSPTSSSFVFCWPTLTSVAGRLDTGLLDRVPATSWRRSPPTNSSSPRRSSDGCDVSPSAGADLWEVPSGWRIGGRAPVSIRLRSGDRTDHVHVIGNPDAADGRDRGW